MAKRKPDFHIQYKMWLPTMTTEGSGGVMGCMVLIFSMLPPERREAIIARITDEHHMLNRKEAENNG